jgi:hypothetical protein
LSVSRGFKPPNEMSHSTSRKGIPSAAASPLDSKAIAASVTSQKTQPTPQSIPPMLKVIGSDAATASIRRSTIRFSIKGLSVSEDPGEISVATWSRRDVTRFTRGIMAFSRNVQLARLTTLCRAVWSWRDNVRGQIDPQGNAGGDLSTNVIRGIRNESGAASSHQGR